MKPILILALVLLLAWAVLEPPLQPAAAQEATPELTPEPVPEATAEPAPQYAWCGYLLLEWVIVGEDELQMLSTLFPADDGTARPDELMQWRPRVDGTGGVLEGCTFLPYARWRVVSLLQQASGMDYGQIDATVIITEYDEAGMLAYLEAHAAEWEPVNAPNPEATPEL